MKALRLHAPAIVLGLALVLASCSDTASATTIDCRLVAGTDANADTASIPFGAGGIELSVTGLRASVAVTVGELRGSIRITVQGTGSNGEPDAARITTATANFDRDGDREEPGSLMVSLEGLLPDAMSYSAYCWAP